MNPWLRGFLLGVTGGGFVWSMTRVLSRREEPEPVENAPVDPNAPPFPSVMVESGKYLTTEAGQAFITMRASAAADGITIPLTTAWRSREWQQRLYDEYQAYLAGGPWAPMAAKPGNSLHEKGIAIDVAGVNPAASNFNPTRAAWLKQYAATYGFYNTGAFFSRPEPWHYAFGVQREGLALIA